MNPGFDLHQLRSFCQAVRSGSISRAAETLCIAQPALSRQIRMLEDRLGVTLLVRHGRGVVPTASGQILVERAAVLLAQAQSIQDEVRAVEGQVSGEVCFGILPSVAHNLSAGILQRYREAYPRVKLRVEQAMSGSLHALTEQNEINLCITYLSTASRSLDCFLLMEEHLYLVGPAHSPVSSRRHVGLTQALKQPLALPGRDHALRVLIERAAQNTGLPVQVDIEVNSLPLQLDLVYRGLAHTILPLATVVERVRRRELTACPIRKPSLTRQLVLAAPRNKPVSAASIALRKLLIDSVAEQIRLGNWPGARSLSARA